jgi:hypothetical protein
MSCPPSRPEVPSQFSDRKAHTIMEHSQRQIVCGVDPVHSDLFAREPDDIHLICSLG